MKSLIVSELKVDENLVLIPFKEEDAKELFLLTDKNRGHLREWLPWLDFTLKEDDTLKFLQNVINQADRKEGLQFGIWYDGKLVGAIGHHKIDWINRRVSLGYWLDKDMTGKGIIVRSCEKLIEITFKDINLNLITIAVATENIKSKSIPKKLGFTYEGTLRQREWLYDHFVDHDIYSLLNSEWKEKK
ncbi:GNAT family protein [Bacteriovoracaceae bacterium]|nr:GNAT family protein [Bacteriovoracaceae bacterium]